MLSDCTSMELQIPSLHLGRVYLVVKLRFLLEHVRVELSYFSTKTPLVWKEYVVPRRDYEGNIPWLLQDFLGEDSILPSAAEGRLKKLLIELYRCVSSIEEYNYYGEENLNYGFESKSR
jgi:hypothetical protein